MVVYAIVSSIMFYIGLEMPHINRSSYKISYENLHREIPYKLFGHTTTSILISFFIAIVEPAFLWVAIGHLFHVLRDVAK